MSVPMTQLAEVAQPGEENSPAQTAPAIRNAVAIIVTRFPKLDETFILREITELERIGQPVLVVPLLRDRSSGMHEEARIRNRRAFHSPLLSPGTALSNIRVFWKYPLRYLRLLLRLIAGTILNPSTLIRTMALFPKAVHLAHVLPPRGIRHVHSYFASHATTIAYVIASLSDITFSFTVQGPDVFLHRSLLREKIGAASFIRATSVFNKAFLSGLFPDLTEGKIEVVHNGVDGRLYQETPFPRPAPGVSWKVLTVSAASPSRGIGFLIDAVALLRHEGLDVECQVIGADPVRGSVEERVAHHGIADAVHLLGPQPPQEVARLMTACDVFVLPSIVAFDGQMDGIPISLMEAMAAGKPVIASAISGIPELVRQGDNGLLVDSTHPERIAAAIRMLIDDPALRERLGRAAQQMVDSSFAVSATVSKLVDLIDRHDRTNDVSPSTASRILSLDWSRLNVCALGIRKVRNGEHSTIAEVTITDGIRQRDVIVRRQRIDAGDPAPARLRARREFEILSVLRQSLRTDEENGGTTYSVPRVLMFDERNAAVVVERADGLSLTSLLRQARTRGRIDRIRAGLRKSARWLQFMQCQARPDIDPEEIVSMVTRLALHDLEMAAAADGWLRRHRVAITEKLHGLEREVQRGSVEVVSHHGDFSPDNVFIGERRVDVVAFESWRAGLAVEDVAEMLLHLELELGWSLVRHLLPNLKTTFIQSWQGSGTSAPPAHEIEFATITRALHMLASGQPEGVLRSWRYRQILRRAIGRSLGR